jgi:hypothetical protein
VVKVSFLMSIGRRTLVRTLWWVAATAWAHLSRCVKWSSQVFVLTVKLNSLPESREALSLDSLSP